MATRLGWKITSDWERAVLLAYQRCLDQNAARFIIEDTASPQELETALHLLLSDVCDPSLYRIRYSVRSGFKLLFEDPSIRFVATIGEWIGNRNHGVVLVDAIKRVREKYRIAPP